MNRSTISEAGYLKSLLHYFDFKKTNKKNSLFFYLSSRRDPRFFCLFQGMVLRYGLVNKSAKKDHRQKTLNCGILYHHDQFI